MRHRPKVVLLIAAFLFAATAIAAAVGSSLLFPDTLLDEMWNLNRPAYTAFEVIGKWSGALFLLLGIGTAAAGLGLLRGAKWAWWFAMVLFSLNGVGDILTLLTSKDAVKSGFGVIIAAGFIFCLLRPNVIAFFRGLV